jgi:hypothetical protein
MFGEEDLVLLRSNPGPNAASGSSKNRLIKAIESMKNSYLQALA